MTSVPTDKNLSVEFALADTYEDAQKLGPDKKSYTFHIIFRHQEHTLTDTEVNNVVDRIIKRLQDTLHVTLRS